MIDQQIKKQFKTRAAFCRETGKTENERKNLGRTIDSIYKKIDEFKEWLKPLGIDIKIVLKDQNGKI